MSNYLSMSDALVKALTEAVTKVENDRTLWSAEWQVWLLDAQAALRAHGAMREGKG